MGNTRGAIVTWCESHTFWFQVILFGLTIPLALYNQEIRNLLHSLVRGITQRSGDVHRAYRYNSAKNKLELLKSLHGNAYNLCLYVFSTTIGIVVVVIAIAVVVSVGYLLIFRKTPTTLVITAFMPGVVVGNLLRMFFTFTNLYRYPDRVKELEREIESNAPKRATVTA